ncbi:MAG: hypothetical protein KDD94_15035 [Calditrichaeota bacterium]|nr:hypothetical protein [Calditrichota bacterium]
MNSGRLFSIGSYILIFASLAHLSGHFAKKIPKNESEKQLLDLAVSYRFQTYGSIERTFIDFLDGFSLSFSLSTFFVGLVNLVIVKLANDHQKLVSTITLINSVTCLLFFIITITYLVLPLIIFYGLASSFFLIAFIQQKYAKI